MVEGGMSCVKYLVFAFNLLFFLLGVALIGVGAYVQIQLKDYLDFFSRDVNGPAILLIVVGLIIFIIAFFGCCGAIKENYCMILTFSILLILILICEIGAGIAGFVYRNQVTEFVGTEMRTSMKQYGVDGKEGVQKTWDYAQEQFSCCGVDSPDDWKDVLPSGPPRSCCPSNVDNCIYNTPTVNATYIHGCRHRLESIVKNNVYYVGAVGIALAIIQITGVVISCCLGRSIKREYDIV